MPKQPDPQTTPDSLHKDIGDMVKMLTVARQKAVQAKKMVKNLEDKLIELYRERERREING